MWKGGTFIMSNYARLHVTSMQCDSWKCHFCSFFKRARKILFLRINMIWHLQHDRVKENTCEKWRTVHHAHTHTHSPCWVVRMHNWGSPTRHVWMSRYSTSPPTNTSPTEQRAEISVELMREAAATQHCSILITCVVLCSNAYTVTVHEEGPLSGEFLCSELK